MTAERPGAPVPKPWEIIVDLHPGGDVGVWAQVKVDLRGGRTSPPRVVLPPEGMTTGCGHIEEGMGPEPCGLGGRHRWVLEAIRQTEWNRPVPRGRLTFRHPLPRRLVRLELRRGDSYEVDLDAVGAAAVDPEGGWDWWKRTAGFGEPDPIDVVRATLDGVELDLEGREVQEAMETMRRANSVFDGHAPIVNTSDEKATTRRATPADLEAAIGRVAGWIVERIVEAYAAGRPEEAEEHRRWFVGTMSSGSGGREGPSYATGGRGIVLGWPDGHVVFVKWSEIMRTLRRRAVPDPQGSLF